MIDLGDELADYDGKPEGPPPQEMRGYAHGMQSAGRLADLQAQGFNNVPPLGIGGIPGIDDRPPWPDGGSAAPWVPDPLPPWILVTESADGSGVTYHDTRNDDQGS